MDQWYPIQNWYASLQKALEQTVKNAYGDKWRASDNRDLACDIVGIEGICEVDRFEFHDEDEEIWIYVIIGKHITKIYEVQTAVYQALGMASEDYFVLVPFYSHTMLQFWFMMGSRSHAHRGRVIVAKEDNPHIIM
ncbi:MAG TPA: hypothetical protein VFV38_22930 [Ktedonobacteraceae bacterium]|nr:hypothetical protein [Ktedonobacteraceae bacterium]